MDLSGVTVVCDKGALKLSKVIDGIAYDLDGEVIPRRFFRHELSILDNNWVREKTTTQQSVDNLAMI
jgi:hypothetical protein